MKFILRNIISSTNIIKVSTAPSAALSLVKPQTCHVLCCQLHLHTSKVPRLVLPAPSSYLKPATSCAASSIFISQTCHVLCYQLHLHTSNLPCLVLPAPSSYLKTATSCAASSIFIPQNCHVLCCHLHLHTSNLPRLVLPAPSSYLKAAVYTSFSGSYFRAFFVTLFLCSLVVSTAVTVWQYCHQFF